MELGLVQKVNIEEEMQQAYLDYAMSVIVARALPDARDGLKPVHRRILYAMYDMGVRPDLPSKKSARIVGEVLGKYHPHGDMAVYDAMARMAQDFSMRYTLVEGQGNFGSIDGDPPAAMRYTEARLARPAMEMLTDIAKNTVDFVDNFDGTLTEPSVLPSSIPNLLVNGATGIAVGMATSIPPHNLGEIVDGMQFLLSRWDDLDEISVEDLLKYVQGPDFPTGGVIVHSPEGEGLVSTYSTGRGQVTIQARAHQEEMERGRSRIIVTELPYMTNKSTLIERIAELARESRIEGIADLRDESDRQGMRIVIELSKTADPDKVLHALYHHTPMQSTFSIIMLALVDGEPRMLSLKQCMRVFLEHRLEIIRRRSQFELEKARQRLHILEGYRVALKNLDEVIDLIRKAPDADQARTRLMKRFKLSEIQAQAILDLQLRRLAALERKKIEEEYKEILGHIKVLEALLRSPKKMRQVVSEDLLAIKEMFNDRRRTHIVTLKAGQTSASLARSSGLVPEKEVWVSITADGLISRSLEDKIPRLSGKDAPFHLARVNTRDTIYLACEQGLCAAQPVHAIPESDDPSQGTLVTKIFPLKDEHRLVEVFSIPPRNGIDIDRSSLEKLFVVTATRQGMIKKTAIVELPGPSANLFTLARVNEGDQLGWVRISSGKNQVLLATSSGMAIRFKEEEVRPMGMVAAGVMGIKLAGEDSLVGMEILPRPGEVFLITTTGRAKRLVASQFPIQGRYGLGVQAWKLAPRETLAGMAVGKGTQRVTVSISRLLPRTIRLDEAPIQARAARGMSLLDLKPGDQVTHLTLPWETMRPSGGRVPVAQSETTKESGAAGKTSQSSTRVTSKSLGKAASAGVEKTAGKSKKPPAKQVTAVKKTVSSRKPITVISSTKNSTPGANPAHAAVKSTPVVSEKKGTAHALKKKPAPRTKPGVRGRTPPKASSQPVPKTKKPAPGAGRSKEKEKR
ncbi:MAG: DNA gyrase subunit A [Chloroflexi bacterium RBG_16_54_18]|nr:MAG: DNA gyrase subunit A [Chloroflexi bacterium RBG_16_54_18]